MIPRGAIPVLILLAAAVSAMSCAGAKPAPRPPLGTLRFECTPPDAVLTVNEQRLGPVSMFKEKGVMVPPGEHRIVLKAEDHFTAMELVRVAKDETRTVKIDLRPTPP